MQGLRYRSHATIGAGHCSQQKLPAQTICSHAGLHPVSSSKDSSRNAARNMSAAATDSDWGELPVAAPSGTSTSSASNRPASSKQRNSSSTTDSHGSWYEPAAEKKRLPTSRLARRSSSSTSGTARRDSSHSAPSNRQQQQQGARRGTSSSSSSSNNNTETDDRWTHSSSGSRPSIREQRSAPLRDMQKYSSSESSSSAHSPAMSDDTKSSSSSSSSRDRAGGPSSNSSSSSKVQYGGVRVDTDAWDSIGRKFGIDSLGSSIGEEESSRSGSSSSSRGQSPPAASRALFNNDPLRSSSNSSSRERASTSRYESSSSGGSSSSRERLYNSRHDTGGSNSNREQWVSPGVGSTSTSSRDRDDNTRWGSGYGGSSSRDGYSAAAANRKKAQKEKKAAALALSTQPSCYGCGAPLQTTVASAAGYVTPAKYQLKQKHKQLNKVLCVRCSGLCNGAMIPAVQDFTQKAWAAQQAALLQPQTAATDEPVPTDREYEAASAAAAAAGDGQLELLGKLLVTPEQLRQKISEVRSVKALVVLLVDLLDASGTLMSKVRDMVGNNPIVLVGTKMDLLPPDCKPKEVADWLAEAAARRRLLVTSAHLVSSHTGEGIAAVTRKVCRERKGRDVFVVGAANVGKSAFVRAMLKEMSSLSGGNFDAAALATSRYLPVESAMPGTTLGLIPLQAFETGGTLYDTPGVHLHHRIPHMLKPGELRLLHPRKRLTAFLPPAPLQILLEQQNDQTEDEQTERPFEMTDPAWSTSNSSSSSSSSKPKEVCATYLWSGLVRVDVLSAPRSCALVFYSPKTMRVYGLPLLEAGQEVDVELEDDSSADVDDFDSSIDADEEQDIGSGSSRGSRRQRVLFAKESVAARGGLVPHSLVVKSPLPTSGCLADVAVSGLPGWVGVYAPFSKQDVVLRVWVPRGVEVFLRPPLPCPSPPSPKGSEEPEELLEIGEVLARAEQDHEWEAAREGLGLDSNMTEQDEEILKMLMFGDESAGLQGIVDVEEAEDEVSLQEAGDAPAAEQQLLPREQLAVRADELVLGRHQRSSRRISSLGRARRSRSTAAVADAGDELPFIGDEFPADSAVAADGEGWVTIPTNPEDLGLPADMGGDDDDNDASVGTKGLGRQRRRRPVSRR